MDEIIRHRRYICAIYDKHLADQDCPRFAIKLREGSEWNGAFYPLRFKSAEDLLKTKASLEASDILTRRYFYPALNKIDAVSACEDRCPVADDLIETILCLPLSSACSEQQAKMTADIVMQSTR